MVRTFFLLCIGIPITVFADVPIIADSVSPDGKLLAIMDIDRDPTMVLTGKGDSIPKIEITERETGVVRAKVLYFGAIGDDARPLREHVKLVWRGDSKAFGVTVADRFYSMTKVFVEGENSAFVEVKLPSYETMTGYAQPKTEDLRPRGRLSIVGWDKKGRLLYSMALYPKPTYKGKDPLSHLVVLAVFPTGMTPVFEKRGNPAKKPNRQKEAAE